MIICPSCGKELPDGAKFCSKCGANMMELQKVPEVSAVQGNAPQENAAPVNAGAAQPTPPQPVPPQPVQPVQPQGNVAPENMGNTESLAPVNPVQAQATPVNPAQAQAQAQPVQPQAPAVNAPQAGAPQADGTAQPEGKKGKNLGLIIGLGVAAVVVIILFFSIVLALVNGSGNKNRALYVKDKELMYTTNFKPRKSTQISVKLAKGGLSNSDLRDGYVLDCQFSEDGKYLFYRDKLDYGDDGASIYYKDLTNLKKESVKMDSSVRTYEINKSATVVTYLRTSGDLWQFNIKKGEKDEKKIAKNVTSYFASADGSKIVYVQRNEEDRTLDLYLWTKKSNEKLESDIQRLYSVDKELKTIYFSKNDSLYRRSGSKDKVKIDSDLKNMYVASESGELYYTKLNDDYTLTLYYYNGKESEKIEDDIDDGGIRVQATSKMPAIVYGVRDSGDSSKVHYSIAIKNNVKELDQDDVSYAAFDKSGKTLYYLADMNNNHEVGTLFKVTISGNKVNKIEQYDDDVYEYLLLTEDGHLLYYKDVISQKGDLYCDKTAVDSDVYLGYVDYEKDAKSFLYFVDYSTKQDQGQLKIAKVGGKAKQISDDVYDCVLLPNGNVLYLKDYSTKNYIGSLYIYKGSKSSLLDDDVIAIVH